MGLYFEKEIGLINIIKQVKDVRWSRTYTCWYLPCSRDYYDNLCLATSRHAVVDNRQLKEYLQQRQALVPDVTVRVHKSTSDLIIQYPLNGQNLQAFTAYKNLLTVTKYSPSTIKNYCNAFHQLIRLLRDRFIGDLTKENLQSYLLWLVEKKKCSETALNMAVNAIKFYFEKVLGCERELYDLPRPRMPKKLPDILAEEELVAIFSKITNIKHRALLMTSYSMGLRVSELVSLKLVDIDSKRMMVHIRLAKGKKDRYVPLSPTVLNVLRDYFKIYHPKEFLFEGTVGRAYSSRSAQEVIMAAKAKCNIRKTGSIHSLRHAYATHLLENGTDIRYIQDLMGHNDIRTTIRYTHVAKKAIEKIQSPIDRLGL